MSRWNAACVANSKRAGCHSLSVLPPIVPCLAAINCAITSRSLLVKPTPGKLRFPPATAASSAACAAANPGSWRSSVLQSQQITSVLKYETEWQWRSPPQRGHRPGCIMFLSISEPACSEIGDRTPERDGRVLTALVEPPRAPQRTALILIYADGWHTRIEQRQHPPPVRPVGPQL